MTVYQSKSGKTAGVTSYKNGKDFIIVQFKEGATYKYSYKSAGENAIEKMKALATAQKGLSTFIAQQHPGYE